MLSTQEIRQLGTKEMTDELQKSRRELLRNQFEIRTGSSKEVHVVKNLKKYIARLQTIAREQTGAERRSRLPQADIAGKHREAIQNPPIKAKKIPAPKKSSQKKPAGKVKATKAPSKKAPTKSTKK